MSEFQISMFDLLDEDEDLRILRDSLLRGSNFVGGRVRIYAASKVLDDKLFPVFLKDEFGIGGHSIDNGFIDFGSKGITVWKNHFTDRKDYTWKQIAREYRRLISIGEYPEYECNTECDKIVYKYLMT